MCVVILGRVLCLLNSLMQYHERSGTVKLLCSIFSFSAAPHIIKQQESYVKANICVRVRMLGVVWCGC